MAGHRFLLHEQCRLEDADALFMLLPFQGTASYIKGTAKAPAEIIVASEQLEDFEEDKCWEPTKILRLHSILVNIEQNDSVEEYLARVRTVLMPVPDNTFLIGIGGEHTVSIPLVERCLKPGETIISIDAHPDLRDEYQDNAFSHACVMRRFIENKLQLIQIGLNCISKEEKEFVLKRKDVKQYWARDLQTSAGIRQLEVDLSSLTGKVYLSLDADGLCTSIMPGVGTPVPGGISWHVLIRIIRAIFENKNITLSGFDIVEVCPIDRNYISQFTAAKIIQKVLSYKFHFLK